MKDDNFTVSFGNVKPELVKGIKARGVFVGSRLLRDLRRIRVMKCVKTLEKDSDTKKRRDEDRLILNG